MLIITQNNIVKEFLKENHGQITNKDVKSLGLSTTVLLRMYEKKELEKIAPGVYIDPLEFGDDLAALQYRFSKGIYFKDTALFLHGMIDRTPEIYEMNFPSSYAYHSELDQPLKIYRQIPSLYGVGIEKIKSPGGHLLRIYNIERTLCDILRTRDRSDAETIKQVMNNYAQRSGKKLDRLVEYSKIFKVQNEIEKYMEVLL